MLLEVVASTGAARQARYWVRERARLAGAQGDTLDVTELLASELITNAVIHGPESGLVVIDVSSGGGLLRVGVFDTGTRNPSVHHFTSTPTGGRGLGLLLVDKLSVRWGHTPVGPAGKSVWFFTAL